MLSLRDYQPNCEPVLKSKWVLRDIAIAAGSVTATPGAVPDVSLSANVALLNRSPQTFTGANIFDRGFGGPGRLIVKGSSGVDTTAFTGLGFQYVDNSIIFPGPGTNLVNSPMIYMFDSGTENANRMVIAHSPSFPTFGLQYQDAGDKFHFLSGGTDVMTVNLGGQNVGIGTATPGAKLDVRGDVKLGPTGEFFAASGGENLRIIRGIVRPDGTVYPGSTTSGTGFTITKGAAGNYTITFSPAFADAPALVVTGLTTANGSPVVANCTGGTSSGYSITIWVGAAQTDYWFNLIAIGAR